MRKRQVEVSQQIKLAAKRRRLSKVDTDALVKEAEDHVEDAWTGFTEGERINPPANWNVPAPRKAMVLLEFESTANDGRARRAVFKVSGLRGAISGHLIHVDGGPTDGCAFVAAVSSHARNRAVRNSVPLTAPL